MPYHNPRHERRLIIIRHLPDAFAKLHSTEVIGAEKIYIARGDESSSMYKVKEFGSENGLGDLYNFPFLFHAAGVPWYEANDYLLSLAQHSRPETRPTDDLRRRASILLDYLLFCESHSLSWLDFSGARPPLRPTYKYFYHLSSNDNRSSAVINHYTAVIYNFYKHVSERWCDLDMKRVDKTAPASVVIKKSNGVIIKNVERRSQTKRTPPSRDVPLGFVREDGEDLRPLSNRELGTFLDIINNEREWSAVERLILLTSLMTGARKQTVLTIRMKHLRGFVDNNLLPEGAYILHAGPRTGIDTKFEKPQRLYIPKQLADELVVLSRSSLMKKRRLKFREKISKTHPGLIVDEEDIYLFLSDQGNSYYMAKDDPRYRDAKSPQTGQVADTIKKKLIGGATEDFPKDFTYHWLRATYAYQLYQRLERLVEKEVLRVGEELDFIQKRMHHESRKTTENYLKLFRMTSNKVFAQESWEAKLFDNSCIAFNVGVGNV